MRNITEFGLFVGLDGDIDGLVHHSDIAWGKNGEEAIKDFTKGDDIEAKILLIDVEKERVSLGIKQLSDAPEGVSTSSGKSSSAGKGKVVTCTVKDIEKDGIQVELEDGSLGFIARADLARERNEQRPDRFAVGDRLDAKLLGSGKKADVANLSIKALEIEQHKQAIKEYGSTDSGASLGDILGQALSDAGAASAEEKPKKKAAPKKAKAKKEDDAE